MSNRRERIRVTALFLLLSVVGVGGASWTEVSAQERMVLSRPPVVVEASIGLPSARDVVMAVGTLQLLGVLIFEAMTWARRRTSRRTMTPPLSWPVPVAYSPAADISDSHSRQAA